MIQTSFDSSLSGDVKKRGKRKFGWAHKLYEIQNRHTVDEGPRDVRVNNDPPPTCVNNIIVGFQANQSPTVARGDILFVTHVSECFSVEKGVICLPVYKLDGCLTDYKEEATICGLMCMYTQEVANYSSKVVRVDGVLTPETFRSSSIKTLTRCEVIDTFGWCANVDYCLKQYPTDMARSKPIYHKKVTKVSSPKRVKK